MATEFLASNIALSLSAGLAVAMAAGVLGVFMVLKNMSLVSDALSHVALPGIALGLLLGVNPFFGAFTFLFAAVFFILAIEKRTNLPIDAIVGVLFTASLAAGILLTPEPELLEALFGDLTSITPLGAVLTILLSLGVVLAAILISRSLMFTIVAPDLGRVTKLRTKTSYLLFLIMLALVVALGVKFVGTLLMGTLTIIPAAAAKNVARTFYQFMAASILFAALSVILGMAAVYYAGILAGPAVILSGVGIFLVTLVFARR